MRQLTEQEKKDLMTKSPEKRKDWIQTEVFLEWKRQDSRGTYEGATGVGKTRVGVKAAVDALTRNRNAYVVIAVPTETLRDVDWPNEFRAAGADWCLPLVNLMCYASVPKFKPVRDIDLLEFDEIHHLTEKGARIFNHPGVQVYDVLGLTATLPKLTKSTSDKERRELINKFCPSIFKVSLDEAVDLELVSDFEIRVLKFDLEKVKADIKVTVKGKVEHHTEFSRYMELSKKLQRAMITKNQGFMFKAMGERTTFLRNLGTKEKLAKQIFGLMHTPGKRTLVFASSIEQAERLGNGHTYHSRTDNKALDAFAAMEIDDLWVVDALNEGKNVNQLDQSLIVRLGASERVAVQRGGRTVRWRPGHKALIVMLVANDTVEVKWAESALADFSPKRITWHLIIPD